MSETRTFDHDDGDATRDHEPPAAATRGLPSAPPGYAIVGELGRGGMGVVYDAVQTSLNRPCALKMVLGSGHAGTVALIRFLAEAEAVAAIDHPHVVRVFEYGNHAGVPFLAMERLDGGSLADRLKATGPLGVAEAVVMLEQIAAGVQAGHVLGIVHRDLKPANILLTSDGTPKVTDFGLAKRDSGAGLTNTHAEMGTPDYMSPEQAKGQTKFVGPTADVYALGAILFATLSGRPPFRADTLHELRMQVIHTEAPSLSRSVAGLPRDLAVIATKCLAKAPAQRYANAAAFADDLRRWRTGDTIVARSAGGRERAWKAAKRNRGLVTAAGVVALALCVGLVGTSVAAVRALAEAERADGETSKAVAAAGRADGEASLAKAQTVRADQQLDRAERLVYASQIAKSDSEWQKGDTESAIRLLGLTRWDLRGWEYDYLASASHNGNVTVARDVAGSESVAFSADGSRILSMDSVGIVRTWDAITGEELKHASQSEKPKVKRDSPSEMGILLNIYGNQIYINGGNSKRPCSLVGHTRDVTCASFSPDGASVVSVAEDSTIRIWNICQFGSSVRNSGVSPNAIYSFNIDGSTFAVVVDSRNVNVWDTKSCSLCTTLLGHAGAVTGVQFSRDGKLLVTSAEDETVRLWDASSGRQLRILTGHKGAVTCAAFSGDARRVVSTGQDLTARVWDVTRGVELYTLTGHTKNVTCAAFGVDGTTIVSGSDDETVKIWRQDGSHVRDLHGHTAKINSVIFGDRADQVISTSSDRTIKFWNVTNGDEDGSLFGHKDSVASVSRYSIGDRLIGDRLVTTCKNKTAILWDATTRQEMLSLRDDSYLHDTGRVYYNVAGRAILVIGRNEKLVNVFTVLNPPDSHIERRSGRIMIDFALANNGRIIVGRSKTGIEEAMLEYLLTNMCLVQSLDDLPAPATRQPPPAALLLLPVSSVPTQGLTSSISVNSDTFSFAPAVRVLGNVDYGDVQVWSLISGQRLRDEPLPAGLTFVTRADLPDGKRVVFIENGKIVVRDKAKYAAFRAEMSRRLAEYARPKPAWHARSFDEAAAAQDWFAARFHLRYLRQIKGDDDLGVRWRAARLTSPPP